MFITIVLASEAKATRSSNGCQAAAVAAIEDDDDGA
jgi:hypothetical protein